MTTYYGFIPEMTDMILEHVPANKRWARANAKVALSLALGPKMYVRSPFGPLKLNTFDLIVGPSGMYKSIVLWNFTFRIVEKFCKKIGQDLIMPSRFSIEGMIEWFCDYSPIGMLMRDELTTVFKESSKGYLSDILEFISEMYDCKMQKRFTRKAKLEQVKEVYIPIIGATTPYLYKLMKPEFFVQGTGNRPNYIIYREDDFPAEDHVYNFSEEMARSREKKIEKFAGVLKRFHTSTITELTMVPEAEEMWVKFKRRVIKKTKEIYKKNPFDLKYPYLSRSPARILKTAGLMEMSSKSENVEALTKKSILPITESQMKFAMEAERESIRDFEEMLVEWKRWRQTKEEVTTYRDKIWQVCAVLAEAPNRMLNTTQWEHLQDNVSHNTFFEYKKKAETRGWVRRANRKDMEKIKTSAGEVERLEIDRGSHVVVWTVTEKWFSA